jgi:selenocysteine lyase/cysteine desulfurase
MASYHQVQRQTSQSDAEYSPPQEISDYWTEYFNNNQFEHFGYPLKQLLFPALDPSLAFLAHGSYGSAFQSVLDNRNAWSMLIEENPVKFYYNTLFPYLVYALRQLSNLMETVSKNLVFVLNAEYGIQSVLNSVVINNEEDIWIMFDITYEAVKQSIFQIGSQRGVSVKLITLSYPITNESVLLDLTNFLEKHPNASLACMEHITSPTGIVFPISEIIKICRNHGVLSLIDGAHGIGQVNLKLNELDPDFYVTNCHKWLCSARGAAVLCIL